MRPSFRIADRYSRGRPRRRPLGQYRYVRVRWRILFSLLDWLGWGMVRLARSLRERVGLGQPLEFADPRSILLVQLDHLGDAILTTVMLPLLRARYPQSRIEVLASPWNREVFAAAPEVDRVHVSSVNRFARRRSWLWLPSTVWWAWRLRAERYDLAIDVRGEFPLALLLWLTGAPRRLGWDCGGGGFLLTDSPRWVPRRPEVDSRLALLAELGIHTDATALPVGPHLEPRDSDRRLMARRLTESASVGRPLVAVHVGAGTTAKRWPLESWRSLVAQLIDDHNSDVVLVGGANDRELADSLATQLSRSNVTNWAGQLGLLETAALIEQTDLFVGGDSGPAHLAAAVGTPVVVLFSGTNDSRQWRPWGANVTVLRQEVACSPCHRTECFWGDHPCMRGLSVAVVMQAIAGVWRDSAVRGARGWEQATPARRSGAIRPGTAPLSRSSRVMEESE